ncbi:hypothetical protein A8C37_10435 [Ligilactobacillus salivarius]|nr:hypothetical protein A8C37_10435 [Ligilactobacillus salivarius]
MNFEPENIHLEYKESKKQLPSEMWETISAFANTDGGTLFLGVKEIKKDNSPSDFITTGVANSQKLKNDLLDQLKNKNKISFPIVSEEDIEILNNNGHDIIKISVPKASFHNRPIFIKGNIKNTFIREGERDSRATENDLRAIIRDSSGTDNFDLLNNFSIDNDLVITDIQNYRAYLIEKTQDESYNYLNIEEFLYKIGLLRIDRQDGIKKLSKAALLLFGKYNSITDIYHSFFLDFSVKNNLMDANYRDRIYTSDTLGSPNNIISFYFSVVNKITALIQNEFDLNSDLSRKDAGDKLLRSLREALVNSLVHADYQSNLPTKIIFYNHKVEFVNPGQVMVPLSQFFESSDSKTRNDLIFQTFIRAKLGEHTGSGGYTILHTSLDLKLEKPEIDSNPSKTTLTIWKETQEEFIEKLPPHWRETYSVMSKKLIVPFSELKHLYPTRYQGIKILNEMIAANIIEKVGKNKGTRYKIRGDNPIVKHHMDHFIRQLQKKL